MSIFQESLWQFLKTTTAITDELAERQYPAGSVPTGTPLPYLTWQKIDNVHTHHQGGASGLANPRYQFDIYAVSEAEAERIMQVFRKELDMFRGEMGDTTKTPVRLIAIDSDSEQYQPPKDGTQEGAHRSTADFLVWHVEEV